MKKLLYGTSTLLMFFVSLTGIKKIITETPTSSDFIALLISLLITYFLFKKTKSLKLVNKDNEQTELLTTNTKTNNIIDSETPIIESDDIRSRKTIKKINPEELIWKINKKNYDQLSDEPSAISDEYEVKKGIAQPLGYYPSYRAMSPQQRYKYLQWIKNGIDKPIDIGYVFTFYYGLERHILHGNLTSAVTAIKYLKIYHDNESFQSYSNNALALAAFISQDLSYLNYIEFEFLTDPIYANLQFATNKSLSADDIIRVHKGVNFSNNRYIKSEYDLFKGNVLRVLADNYKTDKYYINHELKTSRKVNIKSIIMFANYSLNDKERFLTVPNILSDAKISKDLYNILFESHERTKEELKLKRKAIKNKVKNDTKLLN